MDARNPERPPVTFRKALLIGAGVGLVAAPIVILIEGFEWFYLTLPILSAVGVGVYWWCHPGHR